ncbi:MAG: DNA cytosine methyltransferase, partial [Acidobacteriota bacterium]|nr:DNA cytosine methyltransferase [Acidobacteriota bacterium]
VRSGSYLELEPAAARTTDNATVSTGVSTDGSLGELPPLRRFSPQEVLRLLGFGPDFHLPPQLSSANGWRLAGNSLSVPAVRHVLAAIPDLAQRKEPPGPSR